MVTGSSPVGGVGCNRNPPNYLKMANFTDTENKGLRRLTVKVERSGNESAVALLAALQEATNGSNIVAALDNFDAASA